MERSPEKSEKLFRGNNMRKLLLSFPILALAFFAGCSNDSSTSAVAAEAEADTDADVGVALSMATHEDSSKVVVYRYDQFLSPGDVKIMDADTTQISVDTLYAKDVSDLPKTGNVVVVWDAVNKAPFYLRVRSTKMDKERMLIDVDPATVFNAMPDGDYKFGTDIYFDPNKMNENSNDLGAGVFYNKEDNSYHPVVVINEPEELSDENGISNTICYSCKENPFEENEYVDVRKLVTANGSKSWNVINFDYEFHPGLIDISKAVKDADNYSYVLSGLIDKAMTGNYDGIVPKDTGSSRGKAINTIKAFVRLDTLHYRSKVDLFLDISTSWGIPNKFAAYIKSEGGYDISNLGLGLGGASTGEFKLTNFSGKTFVFMVGVVPVAITIKPNLVFKYNAQAYALMNYNWQLKTTSTSKVGLSWEKGSSVKGINEGSSTRSANDGNWKEIFSNLDLTLTGKASAGVYFKVACLLYNVAGPTLAVGYRFNLNGEFGSEKQFSNRGTWVGFIPDTGYVKLDGGWVVEAGAEVTLLGRKLFNKSYDVLKFWNHNFFDFQIPRDLTEEQRNVINVIKEKAF